MDTLLLPETWMSLVTLAAMEIVLGIDNIVFLAILVARVPAENRAVIRRVGLILALVMRILLLFALSWLMKLTAPLFEFMGHGFSGRDLILLGGGLFLVGKSTHEIHEKLEGEPESADAPRPTSNRATAAILLQIVLVDIVFSLDSVITAVGMANVLWVMVAAMVIASAVMLIFAGAIGDFVERHPSMKVLALSFLILIGVMLTAESFGQHVSKGYIYFAMAFSLVVEIINLRMRKHSSPPVKLHEPQMPKLD